MKKEMESRLLDGLRLGAMAFARQLQEEESEEMEDKEE